MVGGEISDAGLIDEMKEHSRRAVENRDFRTVEFDADVINTGRIKRRQEVLDGQYLRSIAFERHGEFLLRNPLNPPWNLSIFEICSHKDHPGIRGRWQEPKRNELAGVEADSLGFNGSSKGTLAHSVTLALQLLFL